MVEYELEYSRWKWRQLALRKKYADTPPGLAPEQAEEEERRLRFAEDEYGKRRLCLTGQKQIPKEPFAGRGDELKEIRRLFAKEARTVFLSGIGGIGKTALARAYGRLYAGEYDEILIWNYQKSLELVLADDGQLGISGMSYTQDQYASRRRYVREKYDRLVQIAAQQRLLIILDNYNQTEDPWFAKIADIPCDLLVTTRLSRVCLTKMGYAALAVEQLSREEDWRDFCRLYTGKEPAGQMWERIAAYRNQVQGHTLKMKLVLSSPKQDWTTKRFSRSILAGFRLKKAQIQILCELSFLTAPGIPEEVYLSCTEETGEHLEFLKSRSLVQERPDGAGGVFLSLHPVIADSVCDIWHPNLTRCLKFVEKFAFYARLSWFRPREGDQWLFWQVSALLERLPKPVAWRYYIYECLATFLLEWEYFDEAEQMERTLYECVRKYYGAGHQFTAYMALRMAAVCYNSLQIAESRSWYELSYELYKAAEPVNSAFYHDKAEAGAKLARVCEYENDYEAAFRCLDVAMEAMEEFRRATEEAEPELWRLRRSRLSYVYLRRATLYFRQGELERAQQELDTGLHLFPLDEFQELEIRRLQARIYLAQGEYEKAKDAAARDLEVCVRYQGESFKMSLTCLEVLGDALRGMGNIQASGDAYMKVLLLLQEKYPHQTKWMERIQNKLKM